MAHYDTTAEEILWSLDNDIDMVVIGAGTCGTISGVAHKVKERCPKCIVVGIDPYGSILAQPEELNASDVEMYEVGAFYFFQVKTYIAVHTLVAQKALFLSDFSEFRLKKYFNTKLFDIYFTLVAGYYLDARNFSS